MHWLLRTLLQTLLGWFFKRQQAQAMHHMKIEGLRTYLKVLQGARLSAMGLIAFLLVMQLMSFGLALMVGAGVFLAPWELETKLWVAAVTGGVLFLMPLVTLLIIFSERVWYQASGADRMVKRVLDYDNAS
ncbi:MAG: hypothetical protein AB7N80_09625 [Bdellovibrionales bacterium]